MVWEKQVLFLLLSYDNQHRSLLWPWSLAVSPLLAGLTGLGGHVTVHITEDTDETRRARCAEGQGWARPPRLKSCLFGAVWRLRHGPGGTSSTTGDRFTLQPFSAQGWKSWPSNPLLGSPVTRSHSEAPSYLISVLKTFVILEEPKDLGTVCQECVRNQMRSSQYRSLISLFILWT